MKIKPMDDRVLVELMEEETKTASGIIIPDSAKEKPTMGLVVEVGTDEDLNELLKKGDKVVFGKYGGEDIAVEGKEYKIIQRADILAKVTD